MAIADNIVSYWKMDEASGDATDSYGGNTLTDHNTVGTAAGKISNARLFVTGNSEYLSHASNASLQCGDIDFSFAFWVYLNSTSSQQFVTKDTDSPGSSRDYTFDFAGGQNMRFYINGGGGAPEVNINGHTSGVWYFIAGGHVASADIIWISSNGSSPTTAATGGTAPNSSSAEFRVGARQYSGFEGYADCRLDGIGFWKRDIRSDVAALYNSGSGDESWVGAGGASAFPENLYQQMRRCA